MQLVPLDPTLSRGLNFDYTNQVLAWQTLQDVLSTLRPIVGANAPAFAAAAASIHSRLLQACYLVARTSRRLLPSATPRCHQDSLVAPGAADDRLGLLHDADERRLAAPNRPDEQEQMQHAASHQSLQKSCVMCTAMPANSAHVSHCLHVFCYVCLRTAQARSKAGAARCPQCASPLNTCQRLEPTPPWPSRRATS